jgi:hypothetical protein
MNQWISSSCIAHHTHFSTIDLYHAGVTFWNIFSEKEVYHEICHIAISKIIVKFRKDYPQSGEDLNFWNLEFLQRNVCDLESDANSHTFICKITSIYTKLHNFTIINMTHLTVNSFSQ